MLNDRKCDLYKYLIIQYIDNEISDEDEIKLKTHLLSCSHCKREYEEFQNVRGVSKEMKNKILPDMAWDEYWRHVYNRLERGFSWILISIGAIILLGIAVYHFLWDILSSTQMTFLEKFGVLVLVLGFIVLFISVVREKLMVRKHDKYKEIVL